MKVAYGTYAMPTTPLEEAIPAISGMGYDGVEMAISPRHIGSLPEQLDTNRRAHLRQLLADNHLELVALMVLKLHVLEMEDSKHRENLRATEKLAQLARDLGVETTPVIAMGIGGQTDHWQLDRDLIARRGRDYADLAADHDFTLAAEAHARTAVDRTDRALWLIDQVDSPNFGLHFDIVHFFMGGERIEDSVRSLVPITVHTHVTDAHRRPDGTFDLRLLGQGDLDTTTYVREMHAAGWPGFITLEVSGAVWNKDDFDPIKAAQIGYLAIDQAFQEAKVPRV